MAAQPSDVWSWGVAGLGSHRQGVYNLLEQRASSLRAQILYLRHQLAIVIDEQNSLIPVGTISDDVLELIFALYVGSYARNERPDAVWTIYHVCRRWRAVARALSTLWTEIFITRPRLEMAEEFFVNSITQPIAVWVEQPSADRMDDIATTVMPGIYRTHTLRVWLNTWKDNKWMRNFDAPAPALRRLELGVPGKSQPGVSTAGIPIFDDKLPALRSLTLVHITYPPASPLFQNLEELFLKGQHVGITCRGLVRILKNCPAMRELTLDGLTMLEDDHPGGAVRPHSVALPKMSKFVVKNVFPPFHTLMLPYLALPASVALDVTVDMGKDPVGQNFGSFCAALPALRRVTHVVQTASADTDSLSCYIARPSPGADADALALLRISCRDAPRITAFPQRVVSAALLQSYVLHYDYLQARPWSTHLAGMPALATLALHTMLDELARALLVALAADPLLCPALKVVEITLTRRAGLGPRPWDELQRAAEMRRAAGVPLTSLGLYAGKPPQRADAVRAYLANV